MTPGQRPAYRSALLVVGTLAGIAAAVAFLARDRRTILPTSAPVTSSIPEPTSTKVPRQPTPASRRDLVLTPVGERGRSHLLNLEERGFDVQGVPAGTGALTGRYSFERDPLSVEIEETFGESEAPRSRWTLRVAVRMGHSFVDKENEVPELRRILSDSMATSPEVQAAFRYVARLAEEDGQRLQGAAKSWSSQVNWDAIDYSGRSARQDGELHEFTGSSPEAKLEGVDGVTIRATRSFVHGQSSIGIEIWPTARP